MMCATKLTNIYIMSIPEPRPLLLSALDTHLLPAFALAAVYGSFAVNNDYFCTSELIWYFNHFSFDTCSLRKTPSLLKSASPSTCHQVIPRGSHIKLYPLLALPAHTRHQGKKKNNTQNQMFCSCFWLSLGTEKSLFIAVNLALLLGEVHPIWTPGLLSCFPLYQLCCCVPLHKTARKSHWRGNIKKKIHFPKLFQFPQG